MRLELRYDATTGAIAFAKRVKKFSNSYSQVHTISTGRRLRFRDKMRCVDHSGPSSAPECHEFGSTLRPDSAGDLNGS